MPNKRRFLPEKQIQKWKKNAANGCWLSILRQKKVEMIRHLSKEELEAGLPHILKSPKNHGQVEWIVRRPNEDEREVLEVCTLTKADGLLGDNWKQKGSSKTPDGSGHPDMQLTLMNTRTIDLLAQDRDRWALAGDQLYVDFDLSNENLPIGSQLSIGTAVVEVSPIPHNGCKKFAERFGKEAVIFVNSPVGKENHLRGVNAKVVQEGMVRKGDEVKKLNA